MAKAEKSNPTQLGNSKVFICVPEKLVKGLKLNPNIQRMDAHEMEEYVNSLSREELAMAGVRIGEKFKDFKTWFWAHAELVHALRDSLPKRGPNKIQIGGWVGNWGEFCLEFWGVGSEWVRRKLLEFEGMSKFPADEIVDTEEEEEEEEEEGDEEQEQTPTLTDYNKEKALVANLKQLNLTLKVEAETARKDLLDLTSDIEKVGEKVPVPISRKAQELAKKHRKPGTCTTGTNFILEELDGLLKQHKELEQEAKEDAALEADNKPFVKIGGPPKDPKPLKGQPAGTPEGRGKEIMRGTGISWAYSTMNFWYGCDKVDDPCALCYIHLWIPRLTNPPLASAT
jgi:hypothetical protein